MTEVEWLAATDSRPMLAFLRKRPGKRKLRLFACACCRRIWQQLLDPRSRVAVESSERFADELARRAEVVASRKEACRVTALSSVSTPAEFAAAAVARVEIVPRWVAELTRDAVLMVAAGSPEGDVVAAQASELKAQTCLLREIAGNPFRPVSIDTAILTPTVRGLAQAAYDERQLPGGELDPQRLAVLADALEEVSSPADLVAHLRSPGPHVRGCHVVDLCLGKN